MRSEEEIPLPPQNPGAAKRSRETEWHRVGSRALQPELEYSLFDIRGCASGHSLLSGSFLGQPSTIKRSWGKKNHVHPCETDEAHITKILKPYKPCFVHVKYKAVESESLKNFKF